MSLHGKNDRSVHTANQTIARNLKRHAELMRKYEAQGMARDAASKRAAQDMGARS